MRYYFTATIKWNGTLNKTDNEKLHSLEKNTVEYGVILALYLAQCNHFKIDTLHINK